MITIIFIDKMLLKLTEVPDLQIWTHIPSLFLLSLLQSLFDFQIDVRNDVLVLCQHGFFLLYIYCKVQFDCLVAMTCFQIQPNTDSLHN